MAKDCGFFATPILGFFGAAIGWVLTTEGVMPKALYCGALKGLYWGLAAGLSFDLVRAVLYAVLVKEKPATPKRKLSKKNERSE